MTTEALREQVRQAARLVGATSRLWPNRLGFDTRGADGLEYEVWFPVAGRWRVRSLDADGYPVIWGDGPTVLQALGNCHQEIRL